MTQKSCAVGMRNAKLGNHLNTSFLVGAGGPYIRRTYYDQMYIWCTGRRAFNQGLFSGHRDKRGGLYKIAFYGVLLGVKTCKKWLVATHETENGKSLQGRLSSLSTACFSSNQSMVSVPASLLLSSDNLHIEANVKVKTIYLKLTFP